MEDVNSSYDYTTVVLCVLIIVLNFMVVLSSGLLIYRDQQPRNTYVFLGNIALSDLFIGIVTLTVIHEFRFLKVEIACSIFISLAATATMVSILSIGIISIDRYLYILYGLHYQRYISSKRSHYMVFGSWVFAGLLGFMPVYGLRSRMDDDTLCWFTDIVPMKYMLILASMGILLLVLIVVLYSIILKNAFDSISRIKCDANLGNLRIFRGGTQSSSGSGSFSSDVFEEENVPSSRMRSYSLICCRRHNTMLQIAPQYPDSKWKAVKVVGFTTGACLITWFPFFFTSILYAACDLHTNFETCQHYRYVLYSPLSQLTLFNSVLNPIIYAWWHNGFRESVKKMYHKLLVAPFKKQPARISPELRVHKKISMKRSNSENLSEQRRF